MQHPPGSEFLAVLRKRGFIDACTDEEQLDLALRAGTVSAYIGFDATARSLHVGSLVQIMMLRWLQKTGNRPIILMGGGTTRIGDPSFRADQRPLLSDRQIETNISGIRQVFSRYLSFGDGSCDALMLNNAEWLDELSYIPFLREVGRHFSVNRMLAFDSVKSRLDREQSLSFLEFNYMILQSYDFLILNRKHGCLLQIGGSDQWGNIVNGVDLIRRIEGSQAFGLTTPLLTMSDGSKMGKTAEGAVWLNADMFSPFDFWQYWRNVPDSDVGRLLSLFTELDIDECRRLGELRDSEANHAKVILANEVTALAHGSEGARKAERTSREVFEMGGGSDGLPTYPVPEADLARDGFALIHALVLTELAKSGKDARRMIASGAVRIDGEVVSETTHRMQPNDLSAPVKLSAGRKRHAMLIRATD